MLKDHEVAALVNRLRDIALEFRDTEQLRERIAQEIIPVRDTLAATQPKAPDACCITDPSGECISTDPRCMHQPAKQQGAYAELPASIPLMDVTGDASDKNWASGYFTADQLRAFADATHALRAERRDRAPTTASPKSNDPAQQ